jgi:hypothetical protein
VQVVENYSEELGLGKSDSKHSHAIVAAHGAKKLAAMVAAVRTVQFMDRYEAHLLAAALRHCSCNLQDDQHAVLVGVWYACSAQTVVCATCRCIIVDGCCGVCRYHADLSTRGNRLQQLQDNYFKQQAVSPGPGRAPVMPLTTEQKDMAQAVLWYQGMGWQVDESGKQGTVHVRADSEQRLHSGRHARSSSSSTHACV